MCVCCVCVRERELNLCDAKESKGETFWALKKMPFSLQINHSCKKRGDTKLEKVFLSLYGLSNTSSFKDNNKFMVNTYP